MSLDNPPPCIGSGYCCKQALCVLGVEVHGSIPGPCPSLALKDNRYWCGEILNADEERKAWLKKNLYIGEGCCSTLNSDRREMLVKLRSKGSASNSSSPSREP